MPAALFRCDASPSIGAGHVSRCLALAETLAEGGWQIRFGVGAETLETFPALAASGYALRFLDEPARDSEALGADGDVDLLVVDHYGRDAGFERACRKFARKILVLDDATGRDHDCDILLDAAAGNAEQYSGRVSPQTTILAGPRYALVGKSFVAARQAALARRDGRPVRCILVSCGATDASNATAIALDALADLPTEVEIIVALSSQAPHVESVRGKLRPGTKLVVDASNMPELIAQADLGIGTPSVASYERAVLGLPSIVVTVADNQQGAARLLDRSGAAIDVGTIDQGLTARLSAQVRRLLSDADARVKLATAASRLIDGRGCTRVALASMPSAAAKISLDVRLRLAEADDEAWILALQRQPNARRYFRNPVVPDREEHHHWMTATLNSPDRLLLVILADGCPVGVLRLDRMSPQDGTARHEVSIMVDQTQTGRGIGAAALAFIRRYLPGVRFDAEVVPDNIASLRMFERAGYFACGPNRYCCPALPNQLQLSM